MNNEDRQQLVFAYTFPIPEARMKSNYVTELFALKVKEII